MPYKPKKPCAYQGCPNLVDSDKMYCEEHAAYERDYKKEYEANRRDKAAAAHYGTRWKKIRASYIATHPLCEECLARGRYVKAQLVHHRTPVLEGGTDAADNLESLCNECHNKIHKRNDKGQPQRR